MHRADQRRDEVPVMSRVQNQKNPQVKDLRAFYGSGGRDRTYDQLINSQLLYR